jgi:hypothetical protein
VVRGGAAGGGCTTRPRCAPRASLSSPGSAPRQSRGRRRLPGTCQRGPRPGERSAPQAGEPRRSSDHRTARLAAGQAPPVRAADRRRTRNRRTASMAPRAALDRTPPGLRRDTLRDRRPGL